MKKYSYTIIEDINYTHKNIYSTRQFLQQEIHALIKRLLLQISRRPSTIISSIIQSLLWLVLFGALFQNAPVGFFTSNTQYGSFLSAGIIIFTTFTASLNAGLPLIFDREFGFLNRLLISPLIARNSIVISSSLSTILFTILQTIIIMCCSFTLFDYDLNFIKCFISIIVITLFSVSISSLSIGLSFILPGHIEFLAFTLIVNMPILFSSSALAPLSFMPHWLQVIACLNPLTYAIESIRFLSINQEWNSQSYFVKTLWGNFNIYEVTFLFVILSIISLIVIKKIIAYKYE